MGVDGMIGDSFSLNLDNFSALPLLLRFSKKYIPHGSRPMSQLIPRVKGTRDFYPEDWAYQKWLCAKFIRVGDLFGYREYESAILEHIDLYLGKSSEEIVTQQTFTLSDRDDKPLVLRPELTPTLARMVAQKEGELTFPIRWQSYGRFFRYERPQRGRGRSFFQWNIDALGSDSYLADAEMITIAAALFKHLGLSAKHATIRVNDRQGLECLIAKKMALSPQDIRPVLGAIDRIEKMPDEKFRAYLTDDLHLSAGQIDTLYEIFHAPNLAFSPWLQRIFDQLDKNGVMDFVELDLKIARGFDYYTSTVFEAWAKTSLRRALFGGGRYDNLTRQVGGKRPIPGVGFAVGDMSITELLKETGVYPQVEMPGAHVFVTVFSEDLLAQSSSFAKRLRRAGIATELHFSPGQRLDRQFRYADRQNIPFAAVIGPDEAVTNTLVLKDLKNRAQQIFSQDDLSAIKTTLKNGISKA